MIGDEEELMANIKLENENEQIQEQETTMKRANPEKKSKAAVKRKL